MKNKIRIQRVLSYCNFIWFAPLVIFFLRFFKGYKITNLATFRNLVKNQRIKSRGKPIIIAANHLTALDSFIINWALFSWPQYLTNFRFFPWNVPEYKNFGHSPLLKALCYLGKCVYIKRQGSKEHKRKTLEKLKMIANQGDLICLFPEGGRSKTGLVDAESATYGIGEIINELKDPVVWCIYLRGSRQNKMTWFPAKKESFYINLESFDVKSELTGRRAAREHTMKIFDTLKTMEDQYFASGQRYHRPKLRATSPKILRPHHESSRKAPLRS